MLLDARSIRAESRFYSCVGDAPFAKIDARDIGEVVAALVLTEPGHEGRTYDLTGPGSLTFTDIAEQLGAELGREVRYVAMSVEDYESLLCSVGLPGWLAAEFATVYGRGVQRAGGSRHVTSAVQDFLGRPPRSSAEFAREHADAFRAPA
jgi:uncharacterized protein YbjT (DUF2867 family)